MDESGNTFSIKGPYNLNCRELHNFSYIDQVYRFTKMMYQLNIYSGTLTMEPHQTAPYGYWHHTNNATGKEVIYLNTASNNFLEGMNYNYSCKPLNRPVKCMEDFVMPEIRMINGMPNMVSCSTIVTIKALDIIPVTNFCTIVKLINNTESNAVGIKSLSGSCDLKLKIKLVI
jgi:hypothetical protein